MGSICSKTTKQQQLQHPVVVVKEPTAATAVQPPQRALSVIHEETAMTVTMTTMTTTTTTVRFADVPDTASSPDVSYDPDDATQPTDDQTPHGEHIHPRYHSPPPPPQQPDDDLDDETETETEMNNVTDDVADVANVTETGNDKNDTAAVVNDELEMSRADDDDDDGLRLPVSSSGESGNDSSQMTAEVNDCSITSCRLSDDSGVVTTTQRDDDEPSTSEASPDVVISGENDESEMTAVVAVSRSNSSVSDATLPLAAVSVDERPSPDLVDAQGGGEARRRHTVDSASVGGHAQTPTVVRVCSVDDGKQVGSGVGEPTTTPIRQINWRSLQRFLKLTDYLSKSARVHLYYAEYRMFSATSCVIPNRTLDKISMLFSTNTHVSSRNNISIS